MEVISVQANMRHTKMYDKNASQRVKAEYNHAAESYHPALCKFNLSMTEGTVDQALRRHVTKGPRTREIDLSHVEQPRRLSVQHLVCSQCVLFMFEA